jgi:hypothetical protein
MSPDGFGDARTPEADAVVEPAPIEPALVEWGDDDDEPVDRRAARVIAGLRANRRLVPIVAGLGALAAAGSVLSEWRVMTVQEVETVTERTSAGVVSFPTVGTTYLLGLLVVAASLILTLYGVGLVRHHARLVGLATSGMLGLVLIATSVQLEQVGSTIDNLVLGFRGQEGQVTVSTGRGIYLAYAAVGALAFALWLAVPTDRSVPGQPAGAGAPGQVAYELDDVDPADGELGPDWPWQRRHRSVRADDLQRPAPLDLTVEPATPFISPPEERDTR